MENTKQDHPISRKQQRQHEAQRRQRLKPLFDKVREIESQLASKRKELDSVEKILADETTYTDPNCKTEIAELVRTQASLKSAIDSLEWDWIIASEVLDGAD